MSTSTPVYHKSKNKTAHVNFMVQDWPDDMKISKEAFADYAARIESEDFEDDARNLICNLHMLVGARRDSIKKLRASAEYLDSVWVRCRISKSVGHSASVVGGSLTIAGGVLTLTTAGLAAPLLIAGIATSSVGAATNIGTTVVERIINSKQVREMSDALERDKELTLKVESQIETMRRYHESPNVEALMKDLESKVGSDHILIAILKSVYSADASAISKISSGFISEDVHARLSNVTEHRMISDGVVARVPASARKDSDPDPDSGNNKDLPKIIVDNEPVELDATDVDLPKVLAQLSIEDIRELESGHPVQLNNDVVAQIDFDDDKHSWTEFITERSKQSDNQKTAEIRGHGILVNEDGLSFCNLDAQDEPEHTTLVTKDKGPEQKSSSSTTEVPKFWDPTKESPSTSPSHLPSPPVKSVTPTREQPSQKRSAFSFLRRSRSNQEMASNDATKGANDVSNNSDAIKLAAATATGTSVVAATASGSSKQAAKGSLKYSPISTEVFLETGKVVGSNSTRLAGQVIVGVSAAFLAWDVIDLGWTVADLVRKKGSNAGKILRDKADELEEALRETTECYSVEMMQD